MKKYVLLSFCIGIFIMSGMVTSCNKKGNKDLSAIEKKLRDSLDQRYKPEDVGYVYFDSIPVYNDNTEKELLGYIPFCDKIYIDTIIEPDGDEKVTLFTTLTYIKNGEVKKGITRHKNLAMQMVMSQTDSTLLYMCNYLEPKGDFCAAEIKVVKNKKVITRFIPDDSLITGLYLDMFLLPSVALKDAGEVIYLSTYYPACGYENDDWYLSFKNDQLITLSHTTSWADAPYWDNTSVYLPFKTGKGVVMAMWSPYYDASNYLVTDTNGQVITYQLPGEFAANIDQMIYQESNHSYEILDKNGNPVLDEYEEGKLGEEMYDRRWLKWNGSKMEQVRVDTTRVRIPG